MTLTHLRQANQPRLLAPWFSKALLLAAGLGVFGLSTPASAAESIILRYGSDERTVPLSNIESFIETGTPVSPDLQEFVERHPEAGRIIRDVLSAEIYISPSFVAQIREGLSTSTGEFVLIQLNKLISDVSVPSDLQPLETAVVNAFEENDNRLSILEVLREYPEPQIRLDLTGLEPVYNTVKGFVERVLPALEVAREYLQDLICDCPTPAATESPEASPQSRLNGELVPVAAITTSGTASNCLQAVPVVDGQGIGTTQQAAVATPVAFPTQAETDATQRPESQPGSQL